MTTLPFEKGQYLIFAFHNYYPEGGMRDLKCRRILWEKALADALALFKTHDHVQVLDLSNGEVVMDDDRLRVAERRIEESRKLGGQ